MNTPAHAVFNLLVLGRRDETALVLPVAAGAVLPDAPMFWFYFWEKIVRGTPERMIWSEKYFEAGWQTFFDLFNSLPLIAVALLLAFALRANKWGVLFASMGVHCLADLPLHNDDAHRHFFPLSDWRFESPVSYWDPGHFGLVFALAEVAMVLIGSVLLFRRYKSKWARGLFATIGASYLLYFAYVVVVWM